MYKSPLLTHQSRRLSKCVDTTLRILVGKVKLAMLSEAAICTCRLVRLMLLLDGNLWKEHLDVMFGQLQEKVTWLTERPYLPGHMPLRILTLLKCLIEV